MKCVALLALCVAAAAADGYGGAQSHASVETYNAWGSSKYGVKNVHPKYVAGHGGGYGKGGYGKGGYGKFVGGHAQIYAQAKGTAGSGYGGGHGGYGKGGHGGYGGGHGGYGGGYSYKYSADVGHGGSGYGH
ncbi:glycine-rich cell wall structural protein-like [Amphibalanus amphitrite]|uniref:glycine-rich cell wall structural protein-like n=1 Tax=Amphibalanus amphitrite TaxID=1232801 RepID=UPI001C90722D|nr:glycine-rich cell wall structural protein-like [Amphibalanus amphitrite]XP_043233236.1 glycine-rich cell wall structural protein-like [Amphibalanus amphitrite]